MKENSNMERLYQILRHVNHIPRKMVSLHHHHLDNIPEFVLYELCQQKCFNLGKAAYFVDNPDFNCMKGVAGICRREPEVEKQGDVWQHPEQFSQLMKQSPFNQQVREVLHESARCTNHSDKELVEDIARQLSLHNPCYITWEMKHGNHGLLVVEKEDAQDSWNDEDLHDSAHLLSFCPIH